MSDEVREIVKKVVPLADDHFVDNATKLFMDWHIRERKKWVRGLLGKKKEYICLENMEGRHNIDGHNQCRAEILKKIEEE